MGISDAMWFPVKMAGVWLIPKNAEKPIDGRTKQGKAEKYE